MSSIQMMQLMWIHFCYIWAQPNRWNYFSFRKNLTAICTVFLGPANSARDDAGVPGPSGMAAMEEKLANMESEFAAVRADRALLKNQIDECKSINCFTEMCTAAALIVIILY